MSQVALQNVTKTFGAVTALSNLTLDIHDGEFFVLLGPTGTGKTTTLRVIAGLEKQDHGRVLFDGEPVDALSPPERDIAFVFQQYSLYPAMSVYDNLAFPLRSPMRKTPEAEIKRRIEEAARTLRITHLLERKTAKLSGGEMQRVAIGRAIVRQPRIFLMDEPLSNLDAKLRESLRVELHHLQKTSASTTLFVTHDQIEALTMANRIGVLREGVLEQVGTPNDIYDRPASTFVAQLVGSPKINLFRAERENGTIHVPNTPIQLPLPAGAEGLPPGFVLGVRPEDIHIWAEGAFPGRVSLVEPLGVETLVHVESGSRTLVSMVPGMTELRIGDQVKFNVRRERLHYFDPDGKRVAAASR